MSLTFTIDRIEGGSYRAEVSVDPLIVIENDDLSGLLEELKRQLDLIFVTADGRLLLVQPRTSEANDVADRAELEKTALRNEELDELIDRYPVPPAWGDEPGWSDAL